jgi:hypothetical protein
MAIATAATTATLVRRCLRAHHPRLGSFDRGKRLLAGRCLRARLARRTRFALRLTFPRLARWTRFTGRTRLALRLTFAPFARRLAIAPLSFSLLLAVARLLPLAPLSGVLLRLWTWLLRVA